MKSIVALGLVVLLAACNQVSPDQARRIGYERLSELQDGPSLHGDALMSALEVTESEDGKYLVELTDEPRNLLWAVIVLPSGKAEITRMAIDG